MLFRSLLPAGKRAHAEPSIPLNIVRHPPELPPIAHVSPFQSPAVAEHPVRPLSREPIRTEAREVPLGPDTSVVVNRLVQFLADRVEMRNMSRPQYDMPPPQYDA